MSVGSASTPAYTGLTLKEHGGARFWSLYPRIRGADLLSAMSMPLASPPPPHTRG